MSIKRKIAFFKKLANHYKKEIEFLKNTISPNVEQIKIDTGCYKILTAEIKLLETKLNNSENK